MLYKPYIVLAKQVISIVFKKHVLELKSIQISLAS
jgi:hypothetical protein